MSKTYVLQLVNEHKQKLNETAAMVIRMPRTAVRDALEQVIPIVEAEAEILLAIANALPNDQLFAGNLPKEE